MSEWTLLLGGIALFLFAAVILVSIIPRKPRVSVKFLPPAQPVHSTHALSPVMPSPDAVRPINTKIVQLFSRVEEIEKRLFAVEKKVNGSEDRAWVETVPVRVTRSLHEKNDAGE